MVLEGDFVDCLRLNLGVGILALVRALGDDYVACALLSEDLQSSLEE